MSNQGPGRGKPGSGVFPMLFGGLQMSATGLRRYIFSGSVPEQLAIVRMVLGIGLIAFHCLQFMYFIKLSPDGAAFHFVNPIWYFDLLGINSVSIGATQVALTILVLSSAFFGIGLFTRTSLLIALVMIMMLKGTRDSIAGDLHHRYLIPFNILFFFLLSRCGDLWSVDAWRKRRQGGMKRLEEWEASWPIRSSQMYIASFYFMSAVAKLRMTGWSWGSGERLQSLLLVRSTRFGLKDGVPIDGSQFAYWLSQNELACQLLGASTYLFEFGFPLVLLISNTWIRLLFLLGVSGFHIANYFLINVQFLLLPIVFVVFFDLSKPVKTFLARRQSP